MSSSRERTKKSLQRGYPWAICVGDFSLLKDRLNDKDNKPCWVALQLFDALLRGFGQVAFSNNPISGLLIIAALAATAPGTLLFSASTGSLGLLLSVLLRHSQHHIENGITVLNPLLVGAISFVIIPKVYGSHDAFSILLVLLGTIFCVYLARAFSTGKTPFIVWPFILTEISLFLVLSAQNNTTGEIVRATQPIVVDNATSDATSVDASFIGENATDLDWGMVFHGVVVSASQLFALNNVVTASMIYLAVMIYSPTTATFAFLGALIGTVTGLHLGANLEEVYEGVWGFNCFLTGASLGGNFLVVTGQSTMATIVAIIFTSVVQFGANILMTKMGVPVFAVPFVMVCTIFLSLRSNPEDHTFVGPVVVSFPEKQRRDYLASRRAALAQRIGELEEVDITGNNKRSSQVVDI